MGLIINKIRYQISDEPVNMYLSKQDDLFFKTRISNLKKRLLNSLSPELENWIGGADNDDFIFYSFIKPNHDEFFTLPVGKFPFPYFKCKLIKEQLFEHFKSKGFIVDPYPKAIDLCIYEKLSSYNGDWSIYKRYDLLIKSYNEIAFNIGSEKTLISAPIVKSTLGTNAKIIDWESKIVKKGNANETMENFSFIADNKKRKEILGNPAPQKLNYNAIYQKLVSFYEKQLLPIQNKYIKIEAGGLKNILPQEMFKVSISDNQMLFGRNQTDVSAITGIRDNGIYKPSPTAAENKFVFIYQDRDDANKLYSYFKNGLKQYPGLWSYVGIQPIIDGDKKLQYDSIDDLTSKFDSFLLEQFPSENYENYFAIIIEPFSSINKQEVDEEQPEMYYYLKEKLLSKGIASQFINKQNISSNNFHYYLPNISIAILAKMRGIPWRLKSKKTKELVIGFNQKIVGENKYIGSAVFFTNEGELNETFGFPETNSESELIGKLRNAIETYIKTRNESPEKLVIHYYKPQSTLEQQSIEKLIQEELRLNLPFSIIEINDSKSQMDICFDADYQMGMPESGTYVRLSKNEYLLFNNTRYQRSPSRSVIEELPIKIAIHFADTGGFSHKELVSQVYEFSRLYWKGLKQRCQPVTTIYSKLIADFTANFGGKLPNNQIIHNTPWFL